ncbi:hypothetical protein D3C87_1468460 [compost metagenome]
MEDTVGGGHAINYGISVPDGLIMTVQLASHNIDTRFKVMNRAQREVLFESAVSGNGVNIKAAGDYVVSVFLSSAEGLSNDRATFALTFHRENAPHPNFGQFRRLMPIKLELSWLQDFCKGEANREFSARGPSVAVSPPFLTGNRYVVKGSYDSPSGAAEFNCWFDGDGTYEAITQELK